MAEVTCQYCSARLTGENVNVPEGVAYCRSCEKITPLKSLYRDMLSGEVPSLTPDVVPSGCALHDSGSGIRIVASACSVPKALMGLGVAAFWNGITYFFVLAAIAGTFKHATGQVPTWLPNPPISGGITSSPGGLVFLWVFMTPFMAIGIGIVSIVLTLLLGRCEATLSGGRGELFTGIGSLGWFDADAVRAIHLGLTKWTTNEARQPCICIDERKTLRFGSTLTRERREWMAAVLQRLLVEAKPSS